MENGNQPVTRRELQEELQKLKTELKTELRDELIEAMRDSETRLLNGFYGFVQTVQARFHQADQNETALRERVTLLEQRMIEVEKKLNFPGAA